MSFVVSCCLVAFALLYPIVVVFTKDARSTLLCDLKQS
jgi:hypothetical protein